MTRRQQRELIMKCLFEYLISQKDITEILDEHMENVPKEAVSFIVTNTIETYNQSDILMEEISSKLNNYDFERLGNVEKAILMMSLYEMKSTKIDRAVVINEAVEIAKKYCDDEAPKFINGVLDQL